MKYHYNISFSGFVDKVDPERETIEDIRGVILGSFPLSELQSGVSVDEQSLSLYIIPEVIATIQKTENLK